MSYMKTRTYWHFHISSTGERQKEAVKIYYEENKELPLKILTVHLKNSISIVLLK